MEIKNEQKFYSALKDLFVGQKMEGKSGHINLMNIKTEYFDKIQSYIKKEVNELIKDKPLREDLFQKLYTFFESYFNETGTPFFAKTQLHKNLYEKVYSEREDVALFWKTQKLYYVKSEVNYHTVENMEVDGMLFDFDASNIEHQKANEKKELEFYLVGATPKKLSFKVLYIDNSRKRYDRLKEYLKVKTPEDVREKLAAEISKLKHPNIHIVKNGLKIDKTDTEFIKNNLLIINNEDTVNSVSIEVVIVGINEIIHYLVVNSIAIDEETVKRAFLVYKKQNEIDYFIHRDAERFLKEQFDIYLYDYLFGESNLGSEWSEENIDQITKVKKIAHTIIEFIARLEDELKLIWEKPKFVRNSHYVITLDRLIKAGNGFKVIEKIIKHEKFQEQIEEWIELGFINSSFKKNKIIVSDLVGKELDKKLRYLPIDTKYFNDIESDILSIFDDIDSSLDGWLVKSENFQALKTILPKFNNQIQLIYIDPPFNTEKGEDFQYLDKFKDSTWLTLMSNRIRFVSDLLSPTGNFYFHLDRNANYYGRILLENYLGRENFNFKAEIAWDTCGNTGFKTSPNNWIQNINSILHYCKDLKESLFIKPYTLINPGDPNKVKEERKIKGFGWLDILKEDDKAYIEIWKDGKFIKKYIQAENKLDPVGMIWTDILSFLYTQVGNNESFFFNTQKPEHLLRRIIQSSSYQRDIVMDFFCGIGTAVATAHKLNRRWIGIEMGNHFDTFYYDKEEKKIGILGRMKIVLFGDQEFNVFSHPRHPQLSRNINWQGGGFFKYYELEQYEDALRNASYNPIDKDVSNINFQAGEKLLDALIIDRENERVKFHFEKLYPDVDIAETISNLTGKKIKRLNKKHVIFEDGQEIVFDEMTYEKYPFVKPLLWWKSR